MCECKKSILSINLKNLNISPKPSLADEYVEKGEGLNSYHTYPLACTSTASNRTNLARNGAENS